MSQPTLLEAASKQSPFTYQQIIVFYQNSIILQKPSFVFYSSLPMCLSLNNCQTWPLYRDSALHLTVTRKSPSLDSSSCHSDFIPNATSFTGHSIFIIMFLKVLSKQKLCCPVRWHLCPPDVGSEHLENYCVIWGCGLRVAGWWCGLSQRAFLQFQLASCTYHIPGGQLAVGWVMGYLGHLYSSRLVPPWCHVRVEVQREQGGDHWDPLSPVPAPSPHRLCHMYRVTIKYRHIRRDYFVFFFRLVFQ